MRFYRGEEEITEEEFAHLGALHMSLYGRSVVEQVRDGSGAVIQQIIRSPLASAYELNREALGIDFCIKAGMKKSKSIKKTRVFRAYCEGYDDGYAAGKEKGMAENY